MEARTPYRLRVAEIVSDEVTVFGVWGERDDSVRRYKRGGLDWLKGNCYGKAEEGDDNGRAPYIGH